MSSTTIGKEDKLSLISAQLCHNFSLAEIQSATNDFDDKLVIGKGGFGKVFKGCIHIEETSHVVAIKRLDSMSDQGTAEFRAEIEMLSKLRHCNLVSLIGFCEDNKEMILVYEYMPHGTLHDHLHKPDRPLNWVQRLKIAIGAARGLDYLHTGVGSQQGVIHRDIKSSNILLDENWAAMISDFGLSKVGPTNQSISYVDASVKGTFGYLDPEYFYTRKLTRKTDVFAFGVVLFELLTGRLPVDDRYSEEQCSLVRWAQKCVKDKKLDQMVDSCIRGAIFPRCLRRFAQIADRCLNSVPKERPSMTEVVASLQGLLELQKKHDEDSATSSGKMGFTWKIHNYFVPITKQDTDTHKLLNLNLMVQNFIEDTLSEKHKCGQNHCNCLNGNINDISDDKFDLCAAGFFGDSTNPNSWSGDPFKTLKILTSCANVSQRNLLAATSNIVEKNKACNWKNELMKIVAEALSLIGYDASICKSHWEKSSSHPAGEYEYLDVIFEGGDRVLIDIDFRSQFEMARSTGNYKAILQSLPYIFVGEADRLQQILSIVCEAAKLSLNKKGMHIPPWRKFEYMRSKWLSAHIRTC